MVKINFPRRSGKTILPLEADVQKACWAWLTTIPIGSVVGRTLQSYSYMVPNGVQLSGARNRRAMYMASLKAQGFKLGVSDLVIAYPKHEYHGAYIELKRNPGAYAGPKALRTALRPEQRQWLELMAGVGYWTAVSYGEECFKRDVKNYLAGKSPPSLDFSDRVEDTNTAQ